jgi:hypothetical protein
MTQLNPVVQKLAEQAKGFVDLNQHVGGDNGCMIYTYEGLNQFAELIIQECVAIVADAVDHREPASTYVGKIKDHFEVRNSKREQFDKAIREVFKDGADLSGKETP